jgi:hypothetical protein
MDNRLRVLAPSTTAMAAGELRVGCSGWSYKDWRGVVYPA